MAGKILLILFEEKGVDISKAQIDYPLLKKKY